MGVADPLLGNLAALGYVQPTAIQIAALPHVLAGTDVLAEAPTGSGKTVAFGLGVLATLDPTQWGPVGLVLCPTRELASQVAVELRKLARPLPNTKVLVLTGGVPLGPQIASLRHGAHVVVGTPGRVGQHVRDGRLELGRVRVVVLDECDRMLDMGFADDVLALVRACPSPRQTLLFSATIGKEVEHTSAAIQQGPVRLQVGERAAPQIVQRFVEVAPEAAPDVIAAWLRQLAPPSALVFCNTRIGCAALAKALGRLGIDALALHGDLEQPDRERILARFSGGSARVLVATDVAARGLDLSGLGAVVNADLPLDPEVYVHRIGRTGRAGAVGHALSLVDDESLPRLHPIEKSAGITATVERADEAIAPIETPWLAPFATICIHAGRRDKLRPGDVLGACTSAGGVLATSVGKIEIGERSSWIAVERRVVNAALDHLNRTSIKGRRRRATLER